MFLLLLACSPLEPREAGVRTPPPVQECDALDPVHCLLPFPSNAHTVADESTSTGLRMAFDPAPLGVDDDPSFLNLGNGFSRVSGVTVAFDTVLADAASSASVEPSLSADGALQVLNAQVGSERYGERQAYWTEVIDASSITADKNMLIGRPEQVLEANADHVFVVLDSVGAEASEMVRVALGLEDPRGRLEEEMAAHYAPTAAFLEEQGVDLTRVVRFSEFTTRSEDDPQRRMLAMMDALETASSDLEVVIDTLVEPADPTIAAIVRGRLVGAPSFLNEDGKLELDANGDPSIVGTADIEFRISIPANTPDYKVVLYGHGTGGDVTDSAFDSEIAEVGIAKLNLRFDGWTGEDFVYTLGSLGAFLEGSERSTAGLLQSMAGGTVLLTSLDGALGDALSAETLAGEPNPVAGVRPRTDEVVWMGGSLGGTLGAVIVSADDRLTKAVLNVPGTGWSHMIPHSLLYEIGVGDALTNNYGSLVDVHLVILAGQNSWDDVDGAIWAEKALDVGGSFLLQQSMGDPVLPNLGTNLLARSLNAVQLEPMLEPIVGLESTDQVVQSGATLEQFWVADTGPYDVHGFAARNTIAGDAALEQILVFAQDAWEGSTPMAHPQLCITDGVDETCDFRAQTSED